MTSSVGGGIFTSFFLHVFQIVIVVLIGIAASVTGDPYGLGLLAALGSPLLIGVTQLLYQVPAYVIARRKGRTAFAQGIVIGAGITFLLNATCWGALYGGSFLS